MANIVKMGKKCKRKGQVKFIERETGEPRPLNVRLEMIRMLIPIGLESFREELDAELIRLTGERYSREGGLPGLDRWGSNPGSIYLGDQKIPIKVPRVRNVNEKAEIPLKTYQFFRDPQPLDDEAFRKILYGISCRDYQKARMATVEGFGISPSTVSRKFKRSSQKKLQQFQDRSLKGLDIVAMIVDGKTFARDRIVVSVGIQITGEKVFLGFIQTGTENERVMIDFFEGLETRGLDVKEGLLVVIDGSKGLSAGVKKVFKDKAWIHRCHWHKRENIVSYLPKSEQADYRKKLQNAYEQSTYAGAKSELEKIKKELRQLNESAVRSLEEGLEEILTLHKLGLFEELGKSLKTTNILENINSLIEQRCGKVDYWKNSNQKQRWLAAALWDIESDLRKIKGYKHLKRLRQVLKTEIQKKAEKSQAA